MSSHKQKMDQMSLELKVAEKPRFLGGHKFEGLLVKKVPLLFQNERIS